MWVIGRSGIVWIWFRLIVVFVGNFIDSRHGSCFGHYRFNAQTNSSCCSMCRRERIVESIFSMNKHSKLLSRKSWNNILIKRRILTLIVFRKQYVGILTRISQTGFLSDSYPVVELIPTKIGSKHRMVTKCIECPCHAVRNHWITHVNEQIS